MTELGRVSRGNISNIRCVWFFTLALCFVVVLDSVVWVLDEIARSRYIHRTYRGSQLAGKDLRNVYLRWSDLRNANLTQTDLRGADLRGTVLFGADLSNARLERAILRQSVYDRTTRWPAGLAPADTGACLLEAGQDCTGVYLSYMRLANRDLRGTNLQGANLTYVKLSGTDLRNADLRRAVLWGADLRGGRLTGAQLAGARYDAKTRWPANVNPTLLGAVLAPP